MPIGVIIQYCLTPNPQFHFRQLQASRCGTNTSNQVEDHNARISSGAVNYNVMEMQHLSLVQYTCTCMEINFGALLYKCLSKFCILLQKTFSCTPSCIHTSASMIQYMLVPKEGGHMKDGFWPCHSWLAMFRPQMTYYKSILRPLDKFISFSAITILRCFLFLFQLSSAAKSRGFIFDFYG